jgi:hypothetical protein
MQEGSHFWDTHKIEKFMEPTSWRIVKRGEPGKEPEEVIFTIQGVIAAKDLPPIAVKPKCVNRSKVNSVED